MGNCQQGPTSFETLYRLQEQIGKGGFSTVRRAIRIKDNLEVAVKICDRKVMSDKDAASFEAEVNLMRNLRHDNIVACLDFFSEPENSYLVMEYLPYGDLFSKLIECKTFNEKDARDCVSAILNGLKYMHDKDIAHRDLKPENLLLSSGENIFHNIKIADFGFSKQSDEMMQTRLGSPSYVAPEIIKGTPYTKAVDMWSMGVIMYVLLGGYTPFQHRDQRALFRKIKNGKYEFHPKYWDDVSDEAKDLISGLLELDPVKRLTVDKALGHSWFAMEPLMLSTHSLEISLDNMRELQSHKLRSVVRAIMIANRLGGGSSSGEYNDHPDDKTKRDANQLSQVEEGDAAAEIETPTSAGTSAIGMKSSVKNSSRELVDKGEPDPSLIFGRNETSDSSLTSTTAAAAVLPKVSTDVEVTSAGQRTSCSGEEEEIEYQTRRPEPVMSGGDQL